MTGHTRPVTVEVVGLSVSGGQLHWRLQTAPLSGLAAPDDLARELADVAALSDPGVVLHSTSWRYAGPELVLTYALFPDVPASTGRRRLDHHVVTGPGPLHPAPTRVDEEHVAAHAVRHLADLAAGRDPHVVLCASQRPVEWHLLVEHAGHVHVHVDHDREAGVPGAAAS